MYAAQWSVRQRDGKYSDWYLPSREQLKLLYVVKSEVNEGLGKVSSAKLLQNKLYWSSSEKDANSAWYVHFKVGEVNGGYKSSNGCVRAIRAFRY
jgi:hypothetical protein